MSPNAATLEEGWALFLGVDGTILEIAETPHEVCVPESVKQLLNEVCLRLDGALALVSGRSLRDLDQLFTPLRLCGSGVHGCERCIAAGCMFRPQFDSDFFARVRDDLAVFVLRYKGLVFEDKGCGFAVHFRRAPELYALALAKIKVAQECLGAEFMVQLGDCVLELRSSAWSKETSVSAFMREAPFRGRTAIYIGHDDTDEDAFAAVNALGGISIRVGATSATLARYRLAGVSEVVHWLQAVPSITPGRFRECMQVGQSTCRRTE